MGLQVHELTSSGISDWDEYVSQAGDSSFFHKSGWKDVLETSFGHKAHYLFVKDGGDVVGILPLIHMKSLLFGNTLCSMPFCEYGGVVANTAEAKKLLLDVACDLANKLKVDALEVRSHQPTGEDWPAKDLYVNFSKEIETDNEKNLANIPRKQRAMIRKGIGNGLVSEMTGDWERLYRVYSESVRNLGTPVFSKRYFRNLVDKFESDISVLMITHEGQDIAGVLSFYFRDTVLPFYGGSISVARSLKGNDFMYWELMRHSADNGVRVFDYGRSKRGTGSFSFKKNWGFIPEPLHYEYFLVNATSIPEVNPNNPRYKAYIGAWKKLPLPVANMIGPRISSSLG